MQYITGIQNLKSIKGYTVKSKLPSPPPHLSSPEATTVIGILGQFPEISIHSKAHMYFVIYTNIHDLAPSVFFI